MKRTRAAGLVELDNGYALMYRKNVKPTPNTNKPYGEYYVFPGGGVEEGETLEVAVKREVEEEFGIQVEVIRQLGYIKVSEDHDEYLFLCKYVSGEFGTGTGPEFSGDPKYKDRGEYIPTIVSKEDFKTIRIHPDEFKKELIEQGF